MLIKLKIGNSILFKFSLLSLLTSIVLSFFSPLHARTLRSLGKGGEIRVISDKGYSYPKQKIFEATGNVVITHQTDSIYGEKATMDMGGKEINVEGNVRYVGPEMTLYGSKLSYGISKKNFLIQNARIVSDNFIILGKEIAKIGEKEIYAQDAEYTTCLDCPESWTIFGKEVNVTLGKYVKIRHAFIKARGVVIMYLPYIFFPIKTKRETGILFPKFSLDSQEGIYFQTPWYWAINKSSDLTYTPSILGKRGYGQELEYRKVFSNHSWLSLNSLQLEDQVYIPDRTYSIEEQNSNSRFRHFSVYEQHYNWNDRLNFHVYGSFSKDIDMIRDFEKYTEAKNHGSEQHSFSFLQYQSTISSFAIESMWGKSYLYDYSEGYDDSYVQIAPSFSFDILPITLYQNRTSYFHNLSLHFEGEFDVFKQNKLDELSYMRNANRTSLSPSLNLSIGQLGPAYLQTSATLDMQYYTFPYEENGQYFRKYSILHKTEATFELEKIFGLSYIQEEAIVNNADQDIDSPGRYNNLLIGTLPNYTKDKLKSRKVLGHNAYKHSQTFKLSHFFTADTRYSGSDRFYQQVQFDGGIFDLKDTFREDEYLFSNDFSRTSLPVKNTIELQWNNSIVQKESRGNSPFTDNKYLKDNFTYSELAYFNLSQGYMLSEQSDGASQMTRLKLAMGYSFRQFGIRSNEYYFYDEKGHIFDLTFSYNFNLFNFSSTFIYNDFAIPINKRIRASVDFSPIDLISISLKKDYDIEVGHNVESNYSFLFSPRNNCWKLSLSYRETLIKESYAFNFLFNFNDNSFTGLSE